jgi:hypothetical protein
LYLHLTAAGLGGTLHVVASGVERLTVLYVVLRSPGLARDDVVGHVPWLYDAEGEAALAQPCIPRDHLITPCGVLLPGIAPLCS